ncbi:hypothetical protein N665_1512s0006 [Sinapis alba]|nr:hypothetical protein N665_1512s0006 [Sinapis alba]
MENRVGFRFIPTDEEMVDYYTRLKSLGGSDINHVDKAIREVDIYSFDPWELPSESRRESRDQVWYFFCRKENRVERQSRKTKSGSWKKTGPTMDVFRKKGDREKIGEKRVFVFHSTVSKPKSDWVMHEYLATFLPPTHQMTYTLCKVKFKGDASDLPSSSSGGGEVEHSHYLITYMNNSGGSENPSQFNGLIGVEKQTQIDDATDDFNCFLNYNDEEEQENTMSMQEDPNDYIPKMSLTGEQNQS